MLLTEEQSAAVRARVDDERSQIIAINAIKQASWCIQTFTLYLIFTYPIAAVTLVSKSVDANAWCTPVVLPLSTVGPQLYLIIVVIHKSLSRKKQHAVCPRCERLRQGYSLANAIAYRGKTRKCYLWKESYEWKPWYTRMIDLDRWVWNSPFKLSVTMHESGENKDPCKHVTKNY